MPNINFKFDQVLFRYKMKGIFKKMFSTAAFRYSYYQLLFNDDKMKCMM